MKHSIRTVFALVLAGLTLFAAAGCGGVNSKPADPVNTQEAAATQPASTDPAGPEATEAAFTPEPEATPEPTPAPCVYADDYFHAFEGCRKFSGMIEEYYGYGFSFFRTSDGKLCKTSTGEVLAEDVSAASDIYAWGDNYWAYSYSDYYYTWVKPSVGYRDQSSAYHVFTSFTGSIAFVEFVFPDLPANAVPVFCTKGDGDEYFALLYTIDGKLFYSIINSSGSLVVNCAPLDVWSYSTRYEGFGMVGEYWNGCIVNDEGFALYVGNSSTSNDVTWWMTGKITIDETADPVMLYYYSENSIKTNNVINEENDTVIDANGTRILFKKGDDSSRLYFTSYNWGGSWIEMPEGHSLDDLRKVTRMYSGSDFKMLLLEFENGDLYTAEEPSSSSGFSIAVPLVYDQEAAAHVVSAGFCNSLKEDRYIAILMDDNNVYFYRY